MNDEELIAQLRSMHWCVTTLDNGVGVSNSTVAVEAADRIEELKAKLDDAHKHTQAAIAAETREALNAVILTIMEYNMRYGINDGHNDLTDEISAMKGGKP